MWWIKRRAAPRSASIRTKLAIALATALALVVGMGVLSLYQLHAVNSVTKEIREVRLPQIETLELIKRLTSEHKLLATRRTQTTNFHHLAAMTSGMEETEKALAEADRSYLVSVEDAEERGLFDEFRALWNAYGDSLRTVSERLEAGEIARANRDFAAISLVAFDDAVARLDHLISISKTKSQAGAARAQDVYRLAVLRTILQVLIAAVCTCGAMFWISRRITAPILQVSDAMRRLAGGIDTVTISHAHARSDEIGVLIDAVSGYRDALLSSRNYAAAAEIERERLQAAVSNMPVGLCMFDRDERLIICNGKYGETYRLPEDLTKPGTALADILRRRLVNGAFPRVDLSEFKAEIAANVAGKQRAVEVAELQDGRTISTLLQPLAGGGWVAVHEDITERRRAEERISHMARHDALTDLPNRALFKEKLGDALTRTGRGERVAVVCLDLDRFKPVNDTLGHPIGDLLLRSVATRLRECVRETDVVARFGGDEFAIVQVAAEQPHGAIVLAQRLNERLGAPFEVDGHQIVIGVSVGIAVAPLDGDEAEVLLKNADLALYRAKSDGRGTFRFFEQEMDARMQARRVLELDLRRAVARNEFEVHYQPIVNIDRNQITSFEALLRWRHPERGMISPADFIPLAEEIGLIDEIGRWVLRQACCDAASWPAQVTVAVNLSPVQFRGAKLLEAVLTALAVSKLRPDRLELEITEGVLLVETEATLALLHKLRALGVHIAMDDFGTGYSSLSYLRSFPFDRIKIDRSFIGNISDDDSSLAIIRAVASLSTSLGMATTAEGVETEEQLRRLRSEGCSEVQGFLFSAARPACDIPGLLESIGSAGDAAAA
jgi:diguanylate cyclase (GGDEF)-like protein